MYASFDFDIESNIHLGIPAKLDPNIDATPGFGIDVRNDFRREITRISHNKSHC